MAFDPSIYAQLSSVSPEAAAAYLASATQQAPPVPAPPVPAPPVAQPQGTFYADPSALASAAAQQSPARGTLEDFYSQRTGTGGPSVTSKFFNKRPQESWLQMFVASNVTNADVHYDSEPGGKTKYFKLPGGNGQDDLSRPKLVLVVKVLVAGSSDGSHAAEFPGGEATIWVRGALSDELVRAMTAAGDPSGYPKKGAPIVMQSAGEKAPYKPGLSPTKLYKIDYALPAVDAVDPPLPSAASAGTTGASVTAAPAPSPAPVLPTATAPQAAPAQPAAPPVAPASPSSPPPAAAADADEKAALLARLMGQA